MLLAYTRVSTLFLENLRIPTVKLNICVNSFLLLLNCFINKYRIIPIIKLSILIDSPVLRLYFNASECYTKHLTKLRFLSKLNLEVSENT